MSNELDTKDEQAALTLRLEKMLQSGVPVAEFEIDPPMKISVQSTGALVIDCPCIAIGGIEHAGILRVKLTPFAAERLKSALAALETIQGGPTSTVSARSTH